jgi:4'-phosphopantetheinyl transferase
VFAGASHHASVWLLDADALTDEALASYFAWLDASERERLARFQRPARRSQFLVGRVLARLALGHVLGVEPSVIRLQDRPGSAPLLLSPLTPAAGFSISHSGRWVACAVSSGSKLGLDIEVVDENRDIDALAAQAFDADQQAWLAARPPATQVRDFYSLWSRAEAQFKLGVPAGSRFDLSTPELAIVLCCEQVLACAQKVELRTLSAPPPPACAPAPTTSTPKTSS